MQRCALPDASQSLTFPHSEYNPISLSLPSRSLMRGRRRGTHPETLGAVAGGAPGGAASARWASQPHRCATRAPRETDSQPVLVRLADEPLAKVRRRVPREHSGASRRSISSLRGNETGRGGPRPSLKRMMLRAHNEKQSRSGELPQVTAHWFPETISRDARYLFMPSKKPSPMPTQPLDDGRDYASANDIAGCG